MRFLLLAVILLASCATPQSASTEEKMSRPRRVSGDFNELYSRGARLGYRGKLQVRCVITVRGTVDRCRIVRPARSSEPDRQIAAMLHDWRYEPATFQGQPVEVDYVFNLKFEQPTPPPQPQSGPGRRGQLIVPRPRPGR